MFFQSQLRETRSIAVWLAAVVATLYVIRLAGLYRSWVCSEFSRRFARIVGATAVGGLVMIAPGWQAGFPSTAPFGPAIEGAIAASFLMIAPRWRLRRWLK